MLKKLFSIGVCFLITGYCFAEYCPRPEEIAKGQFNGFKAYRNENGTPVLGEELKKFQRNVNRFYSTRWLAGALEGAAHCYYTNKQGRWTDAFLSRDGYFPDFSSKAWYKYNNEPRCNKSLEACRFIVN